jgi:hypothetical protein
MTPVTQWRSVKYATSSVSKPVFLLKIRGLDIENFFKIMEFTEHSIIAHTVRK